MGRTETDGVERSVDRPADSIARQDGMASPYAGAALSPAGRQTVLDALGGAWERCPELRLCELVLIATEEADLLRVEDGELLAALRSYGREDA